ncbi:OmpA family protein [Denitrobaculum tricleocarpae]|uniref:OmpA family protein n=1 Tax=Denitrobaculum tricleocarpae TaxID=2591009 RepID=A0A545TWY1_9PROT|nr:OmpA family protein [Denitrobaculum tricleocarpae]TQV81723.1 OmpA family protein [Denitrobaculum tricleocarpae]
MTGQTYRTGIVTTPSSSEARGALSDSKVSQAKNRHGIAPYICGLCMAALLSSASVPALAQSALLGADSGVFVNEALLDGMSQQGVPVLPYGSQGGYQGGGFPAQPGYGAGGYNQGGYASGGTVIIGGSGSSTQQAGQYVTRPSTLLFPPPSFPRSRVTIIDSGTGSGSGTALSSNGTAPARNVAGAATQTTSSQVSSTASAGAKAESRLLVPLPPDISQQAPAAPAQTKTTASRPAVPKTPAAKPVPLPPQTIAQAKAPEAEQKAAPATAAPKPAAPVKQANVAPPPPPKTVPSTPAIAAAPPPPKLAPKAAPEPAAPKTASVAKAPALEDTTSALTPPPPPPVTPSAIAQAPAASTVTAPAPAAATPAPQPAAPQLQANDAAPATPSTQTASRGDTGTQVSEVQVLFNSTEAGLSGPAQSALESVAQAMLEDESSEVQLFAYAGQADIDATQARRLSLSRAMAVRAFLIGKGVRPARMQVRALGNKTTSGSPDRVDVVPAKR